MARHSEFLDPRDGYVSSDEMIRQARRDLGLDSPVPDPHDLVTSILDEAAEVDPIPEMGSAEMAQMAAAPVAGPTIGESRQSALPDWARIDVPPVSTAPERPRRADPPVPQPTPNRQPVPSPPRPRRSGVARTATAVLWLGLLGFLGFGIIAPMAAEFSFDEWTSGFTDEPVTEVEVSESSIVDLDETAVGDCVASVSSDATQVEVVACTEPHSHVVLGWVVGSGTYPEAASSIDLCESIVGPDVAHWSVHAIIPSASAWDAGDRDVFCLEAT